MHLMIGCYKCILNTVGYVDNIHQYRVNKKYRAVLTSNNSLSVKSDYF